MNFTVLSYNVLFNRAFNQLKPTIEKYRPDIICLQEVDTNELNLIKLELLNYKLADYSNSFIKFGKIYGVATYYNTKTMKFIRSNSFVLPRSFYELINMLIHVVRGGYISRTMLKTNFRCTKAYCNIIIHNIHLIDVASNAGRIKHIKHMLSELDIKNGISEIIAGDFNFLPYSRKNLESVMEKYGFYEATKKIPYTLYYGQDLKSKSYNLVQRFVVRFLGKIFSIDRVKVDYVFYKNLKLIESKIIPLDYSDHFPIISTFDSIK